MRNALIGCFVFLLVMSVVGVDSRDFFRESRKSDGSKGYFRSVLGIAVKVMDYSRFDKYYDVALDAAFKKAGLVRDYKYYCVNDLIDVPRKRVLLDEFVKRIAAHVERVHVFYTLFSKKRLSRVRVYGRLSKDQRLKLSNPTRSYEELLSRHLVQCFPAVCAWCLTKHLLPELTSFHLDSFQGHVFEAYEELEASSFQKFVFPNGDYANSVISTADLLIEVLDHRLEERGSFLVFEAIRPALPEFGEKVLVYPVLNKHLSKITPLDTKNIIVQGALKHPVFWIFKGSAEVNRQTLKKSKGYRNLVDYAASKGGVVKLFDKKVDPDFIKKGDFGVYLNSMGEEVVETYIKLGKPLEKFKFDIMVPSAVFSEKRKKAL